MGNTFHGTLVLSLNSNNQQGDTVTNELIPQFGGEHTLEKLKYLERYLNAFTTALKYKPFELVYIDAFAGPGYWQEHHGSPLIALGIKNKSFDRLIFNDNSREKVETLRNIVENQHPHRNVEFYCKDGNEFIKEISTKMKHPSRAVMFIDPFDTTVDWDTMETIPRLADTIDVIILFPRNTLSRLMKRNYDPGYLRRYENTLTRFFGNESWKDVYKADVRRKLLEEASKEVSVQPTLEKVGLETRGDEIVIPLLYRKRLKEVFPAVSPVEAVLYRNNQPYFELLFAISNRNQRAQVLALKLFVATTRDLI